MAGKGLVFCLLGSVFFTVIWAIQPNVAEWDQSEGLYGPLKWLLMNAGKSPGLKTRITSNGLNYATTKAIEDLSVSVVGRRIPDENGKSGDVEYWLSGMTVKDFNKPTSNIALKANKGLEWTASRLGLGANGNWKYKYKKGWVKVQDSGRFDIRISDVRFQLGIALGMDPTGHPTIQANGCSDNIGSVSVTFHGGASWIYNLFKGPISNAIKKAMNGQICNILNTVINKNAAEVLSRLTVKVVIADKVLLDYGFILYPSFNPQYMETYHKGEVTWKSHSVDPPFVAPPLANTTDTSRMFYLFISDYVFNSMVYAAHSNGFLQYNLTQKDLPPDQKQALNTTCTTKVCIGNFVPKLMQYYPNCTVQLRMRTTAAPEMFSNSKNISVKSQGQIVFDILLPNRTLVSNVITLSASMMTTINLTVQNQKIYAIVLDMPIKASIDKNASKIKDMSDAAVNFIINNAVRRFVKPTLDKLGKHGFPLPVTENLKFTNPKITLATNTLIIATDVNYG